MKHKVSKLTILGVLLGASLFSLGPRTISTTPNQTVVTTRKTNGYTLVFDDNGIPTMTANRQNVITVGSVILGKEQTRDVVRHWSQMTTAQRNRIIALEADIEAWEIQDEAANP